MTDNQKELSRHEMSVTEGVRAEGDTIRDRTQESSADLSVGTPLVCGEPGYHRIHGEETKPAPEASSTRKRPRCETARGLVPDADRLSEPVCAHRETDAAVEPHCGPSSVRQGVNRVAYRVHGLTIGTLEPSCHRRRSPRRQTLRSRVMVARGDGVPVVVGGRKNRLHGEGEQTLGRVSRRRNHRWTPVNRLIRLGSSTFSASSTRGVVTIPAKHGRICGVGSPTYALKRHHRFETDPSG